MCSSRSINALFAWTAKFIAACEGVVASKASVSLADTIALNYGKKGLSKEVLESHGFTRLSNL
jgi:hypothetical protein